MEIFLYDIIYIISDNIILIVYNINKLKYIYIYIKDYKKKNKKKKK